jgi:hypothetical protein
MASRATRGDPCTSCAILALSASKLNGPPPPRTAPAGQATRKPTVAPATSPEATLGLRGLALPFLLVPPVPPAASALLPAALFALALLCALAPLGFPSLGLLLAWRASVAVVPVSPATAGARVGTGDGRGRRRRSRGWRRRRWRRRRRLRSRWGRRIRWRRRSRRPRLRSAPALRRLGPCRVRRGPRGRAHRHAGELGGRGVSLCFSPRGRGNLARSGRRGLLGLRAEQVERVERDVPRLEAQSRRSDQRFGRCSTGLHSGSPEVARAHRHSNERRQPQNRWGQHRGQSEFTARRHMLGELRCRDLDAVLA